MIDGAPHEYKEKKGSCEECGNSPVNHFEAYCAHTFSVWTSGFAARSHSRIVRTLRTHIDHLFDLALPLFFRALGSLPTSRFSQDPSRARSYRSQVIWEEAQQRSIPMEQLIFFGMYTETYRARLRGGWEYFVSLPIPPETLRGSIDWVDDKFLLKQLLHRHDIPTPRIRSVSNIQKAQKAVEELGNVVVKPQSGSRGRHTSVNVRTEEEMRDAFKSAQTLCRQVAIEEYLRGSVCRATVVGGKLVGFFQAHPPRITGDGISTIGQLIEIENARKPERVQDIVLSNEHRKFIARFGLREESILARGKTIPLSHRTGRLFGGYTRELLGYEHPKLRAYAEKAAEVIRAPVVGFDLIIEDPEKDPDQQTWGIIEANLLPYIDLHYLPLEGTPSNVAAAVWDLWGDRGWGQTPQNF